MPRRRVLLLSLATAAAGLVPAAAGCGGDDGGSGEPGAASPTAVTIKTFIYEPSPLRVPAGTTVRFDNEDDILHTVTSGTRERPTRDFDEDLDGAGTSAEVTFDEPGTIDYFCDIHQGMDGQVIVE